MLDYCPGNAESVKGTCSPSDLIQDQKGVLGSVAQNVCYLIHLYHKGGLSARQIVRCTYTGKDTVYNTDIC